MRRRSGALGFGGAIHAGLAAWYRTSSLDAAVDAIETEWPQEMPADDFRTKNKCIEVMQQYTRQYPSEHFRVVGYGTDSPMVEVAFSLDTGLFLPCDQCHGGSSADGICHDCSSQLEPIEYGGIFDTLVEVSGQVYILEHKSTSQLGSYYFNQFKPNNQVTGYVWGARQLTGRRVGGAIVNAIGVYKASATKFERSITTRNDADITQWLRDVQSVCEEIQRHKKDGYFPRRTSACQLYGSCEFHSVHVLSTQLEQSKRLENDYVKEQWDFERRDENKDTTP